MFSFVKVAALLAAAATLVSAENTLTFISQDSDARTLYFTGNPGHDEIEAVKVPGGKNVTVNIPYGWEGNFFSVTDGAEYKPGMLGEVAYNSWGGITFFDVSAIVDPNDHNGVKQMWPASAEEPVSGCEIFPCNFAYYLPDDVQTRATHETDLFCSLGNAASGVTARSLLDLVERNQEDHPFFARDFVTGKWSTKRQ
ncbi:hypothetical protein QBC46DRAFT_130994 [Diplogelasinospora grovesii]|uniref:DNase1 protein n=1 Tax=Diplogelasinospora grovesii TaxID=303347 RepID=A0AAN6NH15_9PEZI|nr:hypothetical protein QBC46DRAFT_130994 [Diplogelasinospora grovesii]